jgi:S1-C subfamily serine protease
MRRFLRHLPLLLGIACFFAAVRADAQMPGTRASCADTIAHQYMAAPGAGVIVAARCDATSYRVLDTGTAFRVGDRTWMTAEHVANPDEKAFGFTVAGQPVATKSASDIELYLIDDQGRAHTVRSWRIASAHDVAVLDVSAPGIKRTLRTAKVGEQVVAVGPGPTRMRQITVGSEIPDPLGHWSGQYLWLTGAVEHGYSGGPLLGEDGAVVAMSYAINGPETFTYAVPAAGLSAALHP